MLNLPRTTSEKTDFGPSSDNMVSIYVVCRLGGPYSEKLYLGLKNAARGRRQGLCNSFSLYTPTLSRKIT